MSTTKSSSMSSVWETLNAMKARRAAAEDSARQHVRDEAARKAAYNQFDLLLQQLIDSRLKRDDENYQFNSKNDATTLLVQFQHWCTDTKQVNALVKQYTDHAKTDVKKELTNVRQSIATGFRSIDDASISLKTATRFSKGLSGFMD